LIFPIFSFQAANVIIRNNLLQLPTDQQQYGLYIIYLQQPWVDDVMAMTQPWLLIAMCESIRNAALPFLKDIFKSNNVIGINKMVTQVT
jgi:hypothetical protein